MNTNSKLESANKKQPHYDLWALCDDDNVFATYGEQALLFNKKAEATEELNWLRIAEDATDLRMLKVRITCEVLPTRAK